MSWNILKKSSEIAYLVGLLNGDGHLQIKEDKKSKFKSGLLSFYSKNIEEINELNEKIQSLFGITGHIYKDERYNRTRYKLFFISSKLAIFVESLGVINGNKSNKEFLVPNWVFYGNKSIKAAFLKGLFSAEGTVMKSKENNKVRYRIGINQYKNIHLKENCKKYLEQIKKLLEEFGITCSNITSHGKNKRKDGSYTEGFKFTFEKKYFNKFYKFIGFDNIKKQNRLVEAISPMGSWPSSKAVDV